VHIVTFVVILVVSHVISIRNFNHVVNLVRSHIHMAMVVMQAVGGHVHILVALIAVNVVIIIIIII
jgi:hypothetical protein